MSDIQLPEGSLGSFHILAIRNEAAINVHMQGFFLAYFQITWVNVKEYNHWIIWVEHIYIC